MRDPGEGLIFRRWHLAKRTLNGSCAIATQPDPGETRTMSKRSAGLLLYRESPTGLEVLLVHPGGPFWARKDDGSWSIPKGKFDESEDPFAAAKREFEEETGAAVSGDAIPLGDVRQPGGKIVYAWAMRVELDPGQLKSNTFRMEWPPRSGREQEFPEVDRAQWFAMDLARQKILKDQVPLLTRLAAELGRTRE
jgi:predicted NUDIX family NTP pyrophosphohydrolase